MNSYYLVFWCLILVAKGAFGALGLKESTSSTHIKIIGKQTFSYTLVSDQYGLKELFSINQVPVEHDEYQERLDKAYLAYHKDLDTQVVAKIKQKELLRSSLVESILAKTLASLSKDIGALLHVLNSDVLQPYMVDSSHDAVSQQSLLERKSVVDALFVQAHSLLEARKLAETEILIQKIQSIIVDLEKIVDFSIKNAIKRCDDTVILKQLLSMV